MVKKRTMPIVVRQKISRALKGVKKPDSFKLKLSQARTGNFFHSAETKRRISNSLKGRIISKQVRENMSKARIGVFRKTLLERFLEKTKKTTTCWVWEGCRNKSEYGTVGYKNKVIYAHRASWMLFNGKIPKSIFVLHKCDNSFCVNPNHLFLGTQQENMIDRDKKSRQAFGEKSGAVKLKKHQVIRIKKLYKPRKVTAIMLSKKYKISFQQVYSIVYGYSWRHI